MGYYDEKAGIYEVYPDEVTTMRTWLAERGGLAIWECLDLSRAGSTWTTPVKGPDGKPVTKPHWSAGKIIAKVTDPAKVTVVVPKEVRRFHVALRMGDQGLKIKLTDASGRKVRAAVGKAGKDAWHEFDHGTQEAVILVPDKRVPLVDWKK